MARISQNNVARRLDESKVERSTTDSRKFTDGNKGTAISDCFVYVENDQGGLNEIGRIELQESRLIGKINSSAAWRVVLKKDRKTTQLQSTTYKI